MGDVKDGQKIFYHLLTARDSYCVDANGVLPDVINRRLPDFVSADGDSWDHFIENVTLFGVYSAASLNQR